jgi:serine phosphatase RsbU (regulator of sigma subunit)
MPHLTVPNLVWPDDSRGHGGMLSAPIVARSGLLGLVVLSATPGAEEFAPDDLDMLCLVATQAAAVLQQIRSVGNAADEAWMRQDLEAAKELQRTFLPSEPRVPGLRVVADYRPAYDIGGDFYDLIDHGRGRITALIGDVSGKGIAAALLMSRISSELRQLAARHFDPQEMLVHANHWLEGQSPSHQFASVAAVDIDLRAGTVRVTNAGHPSPLLRKPNGMVIRLADASGPPLGMFPSQSYGVERFRVGTGDIIVLVTDGVLEALNQSDDGVGMFSLVKLIARCDHDLDAVKKAIMDAVKNASGGPRDDATLLAFQIDEMPASS